MVFYGLDAEEGAGVDIARRYSVNGYPTFILVDAEGETLDRWMGYDDVPSLLETMDGVLADPMPVSDRVRRFRKTPTPADAKRLGDIRAASGFYGDAIAYYRRGAQLGEAEDLDWHGDVFEAMADGAMFAGQYTPDEVSAAADAALSARRRTPEEKIHIARVMMRMAKDDPERFVGYLADAIEVSDGVEELESVRARLLPAYALHVKHDPVGAVTYKKATFEEGWLEDANALNNFAWWCFENEINLDEAQAMARKGVELAEGGQERANVLDTLAELCNLAGDCREAVELMRRAVAEDPTNDHFQEQLVRFEAILSEQERQG